MKASLMMYARPELDTANVAYWALIRQAMAERGIATPDHLDNDAPEFDVWLSPDLVFSQTCGLPYRQQLNGHVALIGTPDFGLRGCLPGHYTSAVLVRVDDPRESPLDFKDARFVYNQDCSQSGYGAALLWARAKGFWFSDRRASGAHVQSAKAVAEGNADITCVDGQTWRLIQRYDAFASKLRVLDWTAPTPATPYITAQGNDTNAMFDAVSEAITALASEHRAALNLKGLVKIAHADYVCLENPPV